MAGLTSLWWLPIGSVPEISVDELKQWLSEGRQVQLIDARTTLEYQQGTIENAVFAPLTDMPNSVKRLKFDPDIPVVTLCLTGHRSRPAVRWLRAKKLNAYSLKGGLTKWKAAGYELTSPKNGKISKP